MKDDLESAVINLVRTEVSQLEDATAFVTDRVEMRIRPLIRQLRKNYWGVFDEPKDPVTGRDKIFPPLTETLCEQTIPNYDLDQKDVRYIARTEQGTPTVALVRPLVDDYLTSIQFGEKLDELERTMAIDGTAVWKIWEQDKKPQIRRVDILNLYVDPLAENLQETTVIERAVLPMASVKQMKGWMNTDKVKGIKDLTPIDATRLTQYNTRGETLFTDVYERWGLMPKYFITGKESDKDEYIEGQIVISGLDAKGPIVHLVQENKKKDKKTGKILKPYEEVRYSKVPGRFYGRGPAEKALMLQLWMNLVVNTRINRNIVAQLGLFKIRTNSGITPQMLSRLPSMGAIKVNSMDDIEQMIMQEAGQSSYQDENVIQGWAKAVTSAFEVVTGEGLPASTPATNASIQTQNAQNAFKMPRHNLASMLERCIDRHVFPILADNIKQGDVIRILGDDDKIAEYVDRIIAFYGEEKLNEMLNKGKVPDPASMIRSIEEAKEKMMRDSELFTELTQKLLSEDIDTKVVIGNQKLDTGAMVTNLINTLNIAPELRDTIVPQIFNFMGLSMPRKLPQPQTQARQGMETNMSPGIATREQSAQGPRQ